MNLNEWAIKWGIPYQALEDLRREFGAVDTDPTAQQGLSEAAVQANIRLEASKKGMRLWRNNVGAYDEAYPPSPGSRWGLCNETKAMNTLVKSADLIGIKPVLIEPHHVGQTLGIFLARECKEQNWRFSGTDRELGQLRFLELVASLGGDAAFSNRTGTL